MLLFFVGICKKLNTFVDCLILLNTNDASYISDNYCSDGCNLL